MAVFKEMLASKLAKEQAERQAKSNEPAPVQHLADWTAGRPEPDAQTPTVDAQATGPLDAQTSTDGTEANYPSRQERGRLMVRLPKHKLDKYWLYAHLTKEDMQDLVEYGLDWVTGLLDAQTPRRPTAQTPANHDMMTDEALKDDVAIFYQKVTGNRWRKEDQDALKDVSQFAPHVIKAGVALSMIRAKVKINSFRYCHGAIHEAAQGNASEDYLKYLLWKIERR